jgi:hypothetical protein
MKVQMVKCRVSIKIEPLSQLIWSMSNSLGWLGTRQLEILRRAETGAETALNTPMISTGHLGQI